MTDLFRQCLERRTAMLDAVSRLVNLESPSDDKDAVDRCGRALEEMLRAAGADVERVAQDSAGDHLRAVFSPGPSAPLAGDVRQILLLGHFDTVWPVGGIARMPVVERDGRLYGPGVFDMKAGLVIGLTAIEAVRAGSTGRPIRIVFLMTVGRGSRQRDLPRLD